VKAAIRQTTLFDAQKLAAQALQLESAEAVAVFLRENG
jgi:hypothetical protein